MIRRLPSEIVDRIAAGEVVERPASVVKELVENALDAGARRVEVDLEKGGKDLVRVADDGTGIPFEELSLALESHATSKLRDFEDFDHLATYGFRGEALASIAAVASVRLVSRARAADEGGEIEAREGKVAAPRPAAIPKGTLVEVRDLFAQVPARRKFLRTDGAELAHSIDGFVRLALAAEGVEFVLRHEGRPLHRFPAEASLAERIREAFGRETAEALLPVSGRAPAGTLEGFVAAPRLSRADASRLLLFVDGRFVRDRALARAVREGFHDFLPGGRFPVGFLFLSVDPATVDPNVHPTKVEVRLLRAREIFSLVAGAVREALRRGDLAVPAPTLRPIAEPVAVGEAPFPFPEPEPFAVGKPRAREGPPLSLATERSLRTLQIHDAYLVRETAEGFEVIDQHALHERILLEDLRGQFGAGSVESQRLLVPEVFPAARADLGFLESVASTLASAGLGIETFGEEEVAVRAVPACLRRLDAGALLRDLFDLARRGEAPPREALAEAVLERLACRGAVMAGDRLETAEIEALLARGAALPHDATCAHARPTRIRFTLADLEKAFQRR